MIDEKKLIADLHNYTFTVDIPKEHKESIIKVVEAYHNTLIECINNQHKIGEWIPCSKRLPEEPENTSEDVESDILEGKLKEYIVHIKDAEIPTCLYYAGKGCWWDEVANDFCKVIAWQPLPEPYKEVQE